MLSLVLIQDSSYRGAQKVGMFLRFFKYTNRNLYSRATNTHTISKVFALEL